MPCVREIRIVDLQHEFGVDDRLVFLPHGVCDSEQIGFIARVVLVLHPVFHSAGRDRRQKSFFDLLALECCLQIVNVRLYFLLADILERFDTIKNPRVMADGGAPAAVEVIFELDQIAAEDRRRLEVGACRPLDEAAESFFGVAGEIRLAQLAVVHDVHSAVDLFLHNFRHRLARATGERGPVVALSFVAGNKHFHQIRRARQAADMSDENPVCTPFHNLLHKLARSQDPTA